MPDALQPCRLPDWEPRLNAYLAGCEGRAFAWGEWDCALFVADAVLAMTGADFGAAFRGQYLNAKEARAALRQHGAGTLAKTFTAALGNPVPLARIGRGDVVMAEGMAAGIVIGERALTVIEGAGLGWIQRGEYARGWKV